MYAFIASAYLLFFPLLMILLLIVPLNGRAILLRLRSSLQLSLIVYSLYLIRQIIGLYQIRKMLKMTNSNLDYFSSGLVEMGTIIILPLLFLHQRILNSWILGFVIWLLLLHSMQKQDWIIALDSWSVVNAILFYISLVTAIYALLWLFQNKNRSLV